MPGHYTTIAAQLATDIAVAAPGCEVVFGRRRRLGLTYPQATIRTGINFDLGGKYDMVRAPMQRFAFDIEVRLALPEVEPVLGLESVCMDSAAILLNLLMPISLVALPTPTPYAGVCSLVNVDSIEYLETADTDDFLAYRVRFQAFAVVKR